jgi:hypothetical protein
MKDEVVSLQQKVQSFVADFNAKADESLKNMQTKLNALDSNLKNSVEKAIQHQNYINRQGELTNAISYFNDTQGHLALTTSNSPEAKFHVLFGSDGLGANPDSLQQHRSALHNTLGSIVTVLKDPTNYPSKEMLDLYLVALHWVLIFHKAIIVTKGLHARMLFAREQYENYHLRLQEISDEIGKARNTATTAITDLRWIIGYLKEGRNGRIVLQKRDDTQNNVKKIVLDFRDDWPTLSIGWLPQKEMDRVISGLSTANITFDADKFDETRDNHPFTGMILYRETAMRVLEEHLRPCEAVIESLEVSVQHWTNRMPFEPPQGKPAITKAEAVKGTRPEDQVPSHLIGKSIAYGVTYVSLRGESPLSEMSKTVTITEEHVKVNVDFSEFKFDGDPFANAEPTKFNDKPVPYNRGFRRRIYIQYQTDPTAHTSQMSTEFIGEVNEFETSYPHDLYAKPGPKREE